MNLCKIGWHDWEVLNDAPLLWELVGNFLTREGFGGQQKKDGWFYWKRESDEIVLFEFLPFHGGLSRAIPSSPESKVCLRCGKTHKNYSEEKVIAKVHELVLEKEAELARRKKAEEMLGRSN